MENSLCMLDIMLAGAYEGCAMDREWWWRW